MSAVLCCPAKTFAFGNTLLLALILGANIFCATPAAAADKGGLFRRKPTAASTNSNEISLETLAEKARDAVVVIHQRGRNGGFGGVGTGFIISADGLVATSLHVIGEGRAISVQMADGKRHAVTGIHAWDRKLDLAIVQIEAKGLPYLRLGDSDNLKQGASVVAMGNPLGFDHSLAQGVVSARRDFNGVEMIQLAMPVEPGNSGGPLLDLKGRVHGVITMKSLMAESLSFAMPINALKPLLEKPNPVPMERWQVIGALNPGDWKSVMGANWRQKGGRIEVSGLGDGFGGRALCLYQRESPALPYELAVTVKLTDESGAAGLAFAADGGEKHYGFYPSGGQLRLTRFDGPDVTSWNILKQIATPHYRAGDWNTLRVRVEAERLLCYVNDELVAELAEPVSVNGHVGLAKFRDTVADFKNFQVGTNLNQNLAPLPAELLAKLENHSASRSSQQDLAEALLPHAEAGRANLQQRAQALKSQAAELEQLAAELHERAVIAALTNVFNAAEADIDLAHATLLIARLDDPELEIDPYRRQLDDMATEISQKFKAETSNEEKLETLIAYLFQENGFHGSRTDYYDRANSYLNDVLDDREGLPITLSVLFLELAQRLQVEHVSGIPVPAHFMVKYAPPGKNVRLIDVFDGGKTLTRTEVGELVMDMAEVGLRDEHLEAATKREIVVRILRNLSSIAQQSESPGDALRYLDAIVALSPNGMGERIDRARLRIQRGDRAGAREDFGWLLERTPPGFNRERIQEAYEALKD